jgi:hypothetical protein
VAGVGVGGAPASSGGEAVAVRLRGPDSGEAHGNTERLVVGKARGCSREGARVV